MSSATTSSTWTFTYPLDHMNFDDYEIIPIGGRDGDRRLEAINLDNIKPPKYKGENFCRLVKQVGFYNFCHNLQEVNRDRVIDRPTTEASWIKVVIKYYKKYDPRGEAAKVEDTKKYDSFPSFLKMNLLFEAERQRKDIKVTEYWTNKAENHPGLKIESVPDPEPSIKPFDKTPKSEDQQMLEAMSKLDLEEEDDDDDEELDEISKRLVGAVPMDTPFDDEIGRMEE